MAFINEYVSEEDIKKYKLEEDWIRRNPQYLPEGRPSSSPIEWTIDRERNIYLQFINATNQARDSENWLEFCLNWDGKVFICRLEYGDGRSKKYNEVPYIKVWELISITPPNLHGLLYEDVVEVLKEALTVYGDAGIHSFVANVVVKFNF